MDPSDSTLATCQETIGYKFSNTDLLRQALMHASATGNRIESNERLEFLGDAILGMVICHELFIRFPRYLEGELTKIKSMVVSRRTCTRIAKNIGLGQFLCVGKGMGGLAKLPSSCTAAVLEAIIGAIYIDGGDSAARSFILRHMGYLLDQADASQHQNNFKSMLQQHAQRIMDATPVYEILDEKGPDHSKCFEVGVLIGNQRFASAWGTSKKDAEQLAAYYALQELKLIAGDAKISDAAAG
jgi:ribonuclease-3